VDSSALKSTVQELVDRIDQIYGLYLDATMGFDSNVKTAELAQANTAATDDSSFFMGRGPPTDPQNVLLHTTTQGEFKKRNRPDGSNYIRLAQVLIIFIYELWETEYRARLAAAAGLADMNDLKIPLFGDLRIIRHAILHQRGTLDEVAARRLESLRASPGQDVAINRERVANLVRGIKATLDQFVESKTGDDPKHRTVWHVK
jgi:hypothetical protein